MCFKVAHHLFALLIGTIEFPRVVALHLPHISIKPINALTQLIHPSVPLGILILLSVNLVATNKRIDAVEGYSGGLCGIVLLFLLLYICLNAGKVFICLFCPGHQLSCSYFLCQ